MFRPFRASIKEVPSWYHLITDFFLKNYMQLVLNFAILYPYLSIIVVIKLYLPACAAARNITKPSTATRECFLASIMPATFEILLVIIFYHTYNSTNLRIAVFQISILQTFLSQPKIISHSDLSTQTVVLSTKHSANYRKVIQAR